MHQLIKDILQAENMSIERCIHGHSVINNQLNSNYKYINYLLCSPTGLLPNINISKTPSDMLFISFFRPQFLFDQKCFKLVIRNNFATFLPIALFYNCLKSKHKLTYLGQNTYFNQHWAKYYWYKLIKHILTRFQELLSLNSMVLSVWQILQHSFKPQKFHPTIQD